jgi:hypothetical protein
MLSSITPLGERGKGNRWWVTATAHVVGSVAGGAVLGLVGGLVGLAVGALVGPGAATAVLAVACFAAAVFDSAGRRPPSWHRQVDEQWLQAYRGWVYGAGFGFQLGLGVVTIITSAATWVVVLATVLVDSVPAAVVIGATFGLARGAVLLAARSVTTPASLTALHRSVEAGAPAARTATIVTLVAGGLAGLVWGMGT